MVENKSELLKMEEYLSKLRIELVMKNYNDGWMIKWLEEKITEVENEINKRKLKHELK